VKDVLLKDLPIAGIEYVFKPLGLPLIVKTAKETPSTSILVRGGPGTGKTTLATALVHAIARKLGGTALYMTTEFVPVEILYKARLLGLSSKHVVPWDVETELEPGTIRVEHLLRVKRDDEMTSSADRKLAAIEAVWDLLDPDKPHPGQALPVKAVVIDAFGLPDPDSEESALRNDLLTLVQMLEGMGISVVIIEEVGAGASHWLPFVTDIVFELSLDSDPDTGELIRKLTCPKSRYAVSLPGPHDYGLEDGKPRLWLDLLAVVGSMEMSEPIEQPGFFLPLGAEEYIATKRGIVMVSAYTERSLINAHAITPGVRALRVDCGPSTRVWLPERYEVLSVPASEGPFSLGWAILRHAAATRSNTVVFQSLEFFLSRVRFRSGILHVLQALGDAGLFVVAHGEYEDLRSVMPIAEYVSGGKRSGKILHRLAPDRARSASLWLHAFMTTRVRPELPAQDREPPPTDSSEQLWQIVQQLARGQMSVESADQSAHSVIPDHWDTDIGFLVRATAIHLLGADDRAKDDLVLRYRKSPSKSVAAQWARYQLRMADDLRAGQTMLTLAEDPLFASMSPLWQGVCAIYGQNDIALSQLEQDGRTIPDPDALALYLRALAVRARIVDMDRAVAEAGKQHDLPPWFVARLQADLRLESRSKELVQEAAERLEALSAFRELPPVHAAEVFYNLGIARDRMGQHDEARAAYRRALEHNPRLQAAARKLDKPA
jgi:KaiC/GvpD/RAD55 family RecA-like ATPase/tetratricopeptide (TPR) repeat protein